jgi:hypothetical protein
MKKLLLLFAMLALASTNIFAGDYDYLTVQKTDGSQVSFTSTGLTITFSGGNLVATQNGTSTNLTLTDLSKMFFASSPTGIENVETTAATKAIVYSIDGVKIGTFDNAATLGSQLKKGVYIVKANGKTTKITVK